MIEVLNEFRDATFKGTGTGTRVTLGISTYSRKLRKALTSKRWEKKLCKAISSQLGYQVLSITRKGLGL